jgi:hypothetical protein
MIGVSRTAYDTAYPLLVGFSSIPEGRGGADLRAVVRLRHGTGSADGAS